MQSVTIIIVIVFFVFIQDDVQLITATICGQRMPIKPLIWRGFEAKNFPWHAAIYHKDAKFAPHYKCGGTVIDSRLILTAAHCVSMSRYDRPMNVTKVLVELGRLNLDANETSSSQSFEVIFCLVATHHAK